MDTASQLPPCPECGGERFWYGSVEFWVGGTSHTANDQLNAAVCGNCGYSSLYLQNMPGFRRSLAQMGVGSLTEDAGDVADTPMPRPPDRSEVQAFRKALRKQKKSGGL